MSNPGKPDAYEEALTLLAVHPIKTWACAKAGVSRASFYEKLQRDPGYAARVERAMPLGRWGGEIEIAKAVLALVDTDFMTGETIRVDGGRHLK